MGEDGAVTLTREEVYGRLERVGALATAAGIDALVVLEPANIFYLSGFRTTLYTRFMGIALRADAPREALLIATSVDRLLALEPHWSPSLLERTAIYYLGAAPGGPLVHAPEPLLERVIRPGDTIGIDLAGASYGHVEQVRRHFPGSAIADATGLLHEARAVKSAGELALLRRANAIAVEALTAVPGLLRAGLTEIQLAAHLENRVRELGADGYAYPTLIGFGPKSLAAHAPPTPRALARDELVTIAFGPSYGGYCADVVRSFFFGAPPAALLEQARQLEEVQLAALDAIRAGAPAGAAMEAAWAVIARYYPDLPASGSAGHSLGLTIHETPTLVPANRAPLARDMVLAVEPRQPPSAMPGIGLYRQCDVVRVTDDGYELLTPLQRGLVVVAG